MINYDILIQIIESWLILIIFTHLLVMKKFECRCQPLLSFIIISVSVIGVYYYLHFTEITVYTEVYLVALLIISLYNIFFKGKVFYISLSCIILLQFFLLSRVWMYIIYSVLTILAKEIDGVSKIIHFIDMTPFFSRNLIFVLLALWLYIKLRSQYLNFDYLYENKKLLNGCIIFSFVNFNLLLYFFLSVSELNSTGPIILTVISLSIVSAVFLGLVVLLLRAISEKSYVQISLSVLDHQLKSQFNHYKNLESYIQQSRVIVHDYKHHVLALNILLENNQYHEAKEYLERMEHDLFLLERNKICDNKLIDAIVHSSKMTCEKKGIQLTYQMDIPNELSIDYFDLALIFGNLLNNAIEACDSIDDDSVKAFIDIQAKISNGNLVAKIKNATTHQLIPDGSGGFKTTKSEKYNHGIGLLSVKNSIEKYQGNINFNLDNQVFNVTFMIRD